MTLSPPDAYLVFISGLALWTILLLRYAPKSRVDVDELVAALDRREKVLHARMNDQQTQIDELVEENAELSLALSLLAERCRARGVSIDGIKIPVHHAPPPPVNRGNTIHIDVKDSADVEIDVSGRDKEQPP